MDLRIMCMILLLFLEKGAIIYVHVSVTAFTEAQGGVTGITDLNKSAPAHATTAWDGFDHSKTSDQAQYAK